MSERIVKTIMAICLGLGLAQTSPSGPNEAKAAKPDPMAYQSSPFLAGGITVPEVLLVVSKDLKMFYQAYAGLIVDIDGDGRLDTGFNPNATYVGYYDSDSCYAHTGAEGGSSHTDTTPNAYFYRVGPAVEDDSQSRINSSRPAGLKAFIPAYRSKHGICRGVTHSGKKTFSGNWLNFIVSSRMDAVRKILYGGSRVVDSLTDTFLEPSFVPQDASIWGSEVMADDSWNRTPFNVYYDITKYTPFSKPNNGKAHFFARLRNRNSSGYGPWDPTGPTTPSDANIFPVLQVAYNASVNPTCTGRGLVGHYWDWIMQSRPVPSASSGCMDNVSIMAYRVTVKVCQPDGDGTTAPGEDCQAYGGEGTPLVHKPVGLLHKYGEGGKMKFGLFTGGFAEHLRTRGGILRNHVKNLSFSVDPVTGQHKEFGLMWAMDKLQISGRWIYEYDGPVSAFLYHDYNAWGNPIGEMVFEGVRYLSGKSSPTSLFVDNETGDLSGKGSLGGSPSGKSPINKLLAKNSLRSWKERDAPMDCSKPVLMLISDTESSFDGDNIPGWNDLSNFDPMPGISSAGLVKLPKEFSVKPYLDEITRLEKIGGSKKYFAAKRNTDDCSPKSLNSLADIKGLCPQGTSFEGTYSSAAVAYYAHTHNLSRTSNSQMPVDIYAVTMSAAYPELTIKLSGNRSVSVMPVNTTYLNTGYPIWPVDGYTSAGKMLSFINYFLTDMKVDKNGNPFSYNVQVNFSDRGFADDWEMDMAVEYRVDLITTAATPARFREGKTLAEAVGADKVGGQYRNTANSYYRLTNPASASHFTDFVDLNEVDVAGVAVETLFHRSNSGGHHGMGYTISGTTRDGTYLDVVLGESPPPSPHFTPPACPYTGGPSVNGCGNKHAFATQLRTFLFAPGGGDNITLPNPMWLAAKYGGFNDLNSNGVPDPGEWEGPDGNPRNYFQATNIAELPNKLGEAFQNIARSISTGTATSAAVSSVLSGGISIQTIYYPIYSNPSKTGEKIVWPGSLFALFVDRWANFRDDSGPLKGTLELKEDHVLTFNSLKKPPANPPSCYNPLSYISRCKDTYGNNVLKLAQPSPINVHKIEPIWDTGKWLSRLSGPKIIKDGESRSWPVAATAYHSKRRIYYGSNGNGQVPRLFNTQDAELKKKLLFDNYDVILPKAGTKEQTASRLIEYIQGVDFPGWRSRTVGDPWGDGSSPVVWRLGDIINSKPIIVGGPSSNFDLIYGDASYAQYKLSAGARRQMVYAGANDGMLHAINAGFIGSLTDGRVQYTDSKLKPDGISYYAQHELGSEVWAYIPSSLLPHLQWLAQAKYTHSYYVDLKPNLADVYIGKEWRTVLLGGLRMGGRPIEKADSSDPVPYSYSEIFCLDVTDPESEPRLLWSYSAQELGMPVGLPSVIRHDGNFYAIIPSGPVTDDTPAVSPAKVSLGVKSPYDGYSNQRARLVVIRMDTGARIGAGQSDYLTVEEKNSFFGEPFQPVAQIRQTDWTNHAVYFGLTVSREDGTCLDSGAVYRLQTVDAKGKPLPPGSWKLRRLIDTKRPVSGAVNATRNDGKNLFVVFGTGRLWGLLDTAPCTGATNAALCRANHQNYIYGVMEPLSADGLMTFEEVKDSELKDVSGAAVYNDGSLTGLGTAKTAAALGSEITTKFKGYKRLLTAASDLGSGQSRYEMVLTQPKVTGSGNGGSLMTFTSYEPSQGACGDLGAGFLYLVDTFTGLPNPASHSSFVIPGAKPPKPGQPSRVTGVAQMGEGKPTESVIIQTGSVMLFTASSSDSSRTDIVGPSNLSEGSGITSWREALDMGFRIASDMMTKDLE